MDKSFLLFSTAAFVSIIPPILLKKFSTDYHDNPMAQTIIIIMSLIAFSILIVLYIKMYEKNDVGSYHAITKIFAIIMLLVYGFIFFEEKITVTKIIGIVLGIFSIMFLMK